MAWCGDIAAKDSVKFQRHAPPLLARKVDVGERAGLERMATRSQEKEIALPWNSQEAHTTLGRRDRR